MFVCMHGDLLPSNLHVNRDVCLLKLGELVDKLLSLAAILVTIIQIKFICRLSGTHSPSLHSKTCSSY